MEDIPQSISTNRSVSTVSDDLENLLEQCEKLKNECIQDGTSKEKLRQLLDLNTQVSKRLERRKTQNEIERLKTELLEYKHREKLLGQSTASPNSTTKNKNTKSRQDERKQTKEDVPEKRRSPRVIPESPILPPNFKISVMKQLEELFITEGERINEDGGFKPGVIRRAMDTSKEMTDSELERIEKNIGRVDTDLTLKVRNNKRLGLLRLFYLENFNCSGVVDIDAFMEVHLKDVGREQLLVQWNRKKQEAFLAGFGGLMPGFDGLLPGFDEFLHSMIKSDLIPEIKDLLGRITSKLSTKDISALKKMISRKADDKELLECLVLERQRKSKKLVWGPDDLRTLLTEVFQNIDRVDLLEYLEFELHKSVLKAEIKQILKDISKKLSQAEKEKIRSQLKTHQMCEKDEDILEFYLWAKSGQEEERTHETLKECMGALFKGLDNERLYNELVQELDKLGGVSGVINTVLRELGLKLSKHELNVLRAKYTELPEELRNEDLLLHIVMEESQDQSWTVESMRKFFTGVLEKLNRGDLLKYFDYFLHKAVLKPPVRAILRRFSDQLSDDEKSRTKKEIEKTIDLENDEEILECYLWVKRKDESSLDNLLECMQQLFKWLGNDRTCERLLTDLRKLNEGLKPEVATMLKRTCKKLTSKEKAGLKLKLVEPETDMDDDDILAQLVLQESRDKPWTFMQLHEFMCRTLSEDGFQIFKKNAPHDPQDPGLRLLESLFNDPKDDIRQKLEELSNKVDSLIYQRKQSNIGKPSSD